MAYDRQLSSVDPGFILLLIDQSGSMADPYSSDHCKADFAAIAVNRVVHEIINSCVSGDSVRPRVEIGCIGYGGNGASVLRYGAGEYFLGNINRLAEHNDLMTVSHTIPDGEGGLIEQKVRMRAFVRPAAYGSTPMEAAFELAYKKIEFFISECPDSFPPVVINITDGAPNDFNLAFKAAQKLTSTRTTDGRTLLLNAHIDVVESGQILLPSDNRRFRGHEFSNFLFDISSPLPGKLAKTAAAIGFQNVIPNVSRGFIFNADAETLVRFLNFGSDLVR
jgi:Uncharacterized protein encoded in toxicity protection region of plasmid R478, contains von Willebrand factor (vWF) domain